ncbi:DUF927 domain-containing protein [Tabrizicola sp.]|uniref:DUF927 domain-containing protein n=1 Tax=Tabrizicola sp. TaxID=2005166 RepID=UPI0025F453D6|nr:DUF927 domain-containing protein [Tabrizicola sp.]
MNKQTASDFALIEDDDPLLSSGDAVLNSARVSGNDSPEWRALLARPMTLLLPKYRDRDAKQSDWKNSTPVPFRAWLAGGPDGGLTQHAERRVKGYFPIVFGEAAGSKYVRRKANGMKSVEMVGIDVDSGDDYSAALDRIEAAGFACVAYTSFRDGTETSKVKRDTVLRALKIERDPTTGELRSYLAPKLRPDVLATVEIDGQDHDEDGVQIVYRHSPLQKYRLLFPLAQPLLIGSLAPMQRAQQDRYARLVRGLAHKLDLLADEACLDVSRVFYMPSHPRGGDFALDVIRGRGLTLADMPELDRGGVKNAFELAGAGAKVDDREIGGIPIRKWAAKYAHRLEIGELLQAEAPDKVRKINGNIVVVECPFDEWHSNAGDPTDTGCHVQDGDGGTGFVWNCKHGCKDTHDRLDMLHKALSEGWFDESCLLPGPYVPQSNEEIDEEDGDPVSDDDSGFEPVGDWLPRAFTIKGGTIWGPDGKEDGSDIPLCQRFDVIGRASNVAGDSGAGRIISFQNENGAEVEVTLRRADLIRDGGGGVLELLADAGMTLFVSRKSREPILNLFRQIHPQRHVPTVPRPGWVRDRGGVIMGYLAPTGEYITATEGGQPFRLSTVATVTDRASAGTLDGWKDATEAAFADIQNGDESLPPNFHWVIGACSGFVGPLMALAEASGCGMNFSGEAARGKSTALLLGATAWATPYPSQGVFYPANTTANAVEVIASRASEAFGGLDDLAAMQQPQALSGILYGVSGGAGKSRMAGTTAAAGLGETATFRTFMLLSSERTLKDTITAAGVEYRAGLSRRYPDVNVTGVARVSADVVAKIEGIQRNYGLAGPAFVRWLIVGGWHKKGHTIRKNIADAAEKLAGPTAIPAQREAAKVFALVQIAGELACEAGLLTDADKVRAAILTAWQTFRASDEGKATEGEASMLDGFRSWFAGADGVHLTNASDPDARLYRERWGWTTDTHIVLIADKINMRAMGLSGTVDGLLKALRDAGALVMSGSNRKWTNLPPECGGGRVTNIRIDRLALGVPPPTQLGGKPRVGE